MSLQKKTVLTLLLVFILAVIPFLLISYFVILNGFIDVETDLAEQNTQRVADAIEENINNLHVKSSDWSNWDDTYQYITSQNQQYIDSNLQDKTLIDLGINLMFFFDNENRLIVHKELNLETELLHRHSQELTDVIESGKMITALGENKTNFVTGDQNLYPDWSGLVNLPDGILLLSIRPILTSQGKGPVNGTLIFGRFLDETLQDKLSQITHLKFKVNSKPAPGNLINPAVLQRTKNSITASLPLKNIYGENSFNLTVDTPRDIYNQGQKSFFIFTGLTVGIFILIGSFVIILISKNILKPLEKLTAVFRNIKAENLSVNRLPVLGKDEISMLSVDINRMLDQLASYQKSISSKTEEANQAKKIIEDKINKIEEQNTVLYNTQKAMTDLMEDEKALREELKKEKENIEKIVEERTKELKLKSLALETANKKVGEGWLQIQKEKSILTASISSLPLGFVLTDKDLNILTINQAAFDILAIKDSDINFADIEAVFSINFNLMKIIESCKKSFKPFELKEAILGNKFLHITLVPIVTQQRDKHEFSGMVILIGDVTERKIVERSRNEFFSIASHELRTPLTAIRGNSQLLQSMYQDKIKDRDFAEIIKDIHESSVRLIEIVNDFLNTSRLEMGKMEFKPETFDLTDLIEKVIKELRVPAEEKGLTVTFQNNAENNLFVLADINRTREILINLIGNSIKFTRSGGITIDCRQRNNYIEAKIADTGIGISLGTQSLLFHKFQQAEQDIYTRDVTRGTGLGLYIARLLIENMGGKIWLDKSEIEKGSTFIFTLPAARLYPRLSA